MFIDGRTIPDGTELEADVAIVGAGAAGITLARALTGSGVRIALIESGGLDFDEDTQLLCEGETAGLDYNLDTARLRYFGGSTNHWGGWCRPLEAFDFEPRDWVPHSGWPIRRKDIDPYYGRAQEICQLGAFEYDDPAFWSDGGALEPMPLPGGNIETRFFQFSPPTRFGELYRDDIANASDVSTLLHTNLTEFEASGDMREVTGLKLATLGGNRFRLTARRYILAAGGIENARILLLSNSVAAAGLGNQNDLVGRFFMEHPIVPLVAQIVASPADAIARYYHGYTKMGSSVVRGCLMFTPDYLARVQGLATIFTFSPQRDISAAAPADDRNAAPLESELLTLLEPTADVGVRTGVRYVMGCGTEQAPNPDSRVTLATEKDALGLNRLTLDWRLTGQDRRSLRQNLDTLARAVGAWGKGRVRINFADAETWDHVDEWAHHHMGTTRMAADPRHGVVDADGKVHGLSNLYVAGSSVFPTAGGASNPTLTIVALALRLADHLKTAFGVKGAG